MSMTTILVSRQLCDQTPSLLCLLASSFSGLFIYISSKEPGFNKNNPDHAGFDCPVEVPALADAIHTLYALQRELSLATNENEESMISGSETEQRHAKAHLDEHEAFYMDFLGINFGEVREIGCVAHTSGVRNSLNRWILNWGLAAPHPNSPIHKPVDKELSEVSYDTLWLTGL